MKNIFILVMALLLLAYIAWDKRIEIAGYYSDDRDWQVFGYRKNTDSLAFHHHKIKEENVPMMCKQGDQSESAYRKFISPLYQNQFKLTAPNLNEGRMCRVLWWKDLYAVFLPGHDAAQPVFLAQKNQKIIVRGLTLHDFAGAWELTDADSYSFNDVKVIRKGT